MDLQLQPLLEQEPSIVSYHRARRGVWAQLIYCNDAGCMCCSWKLCFFLCSKDLQLYFKQNKTKKITEQTRVRRFCGGKSFHMARCLRGLMIYCTVSIWVTAVCSYIQTSVNDLVWSSRSENSVVQWETETMRYFYDPLFNYFRKLVVFFAVVTCAVSVRQFSYGYWHFRFRVWFDFSILYTQERTDLES